MLCAWYRLLGAHIGSDVSIGQVEIRGGFDLVEIGSNSYLEDAIDLTAGGVCWDGKNVVCGPIVLKERAVVLERAVILPGSVRQADCFVGKRQHTRILVPCPYSSTHSLTLTHSLPIHLPSLPDSIRC